jgi:hypothetical protein
MAFVCDSQARLITIDAAMWALEWKVWRMMEAAKGVDDAHAAWYSVHAMSYAGVVACFTALTRFLACRCIGLAAWDRAPPWHKEYLAWCYWNQQTSRAGALRLPEIIEHVRADGDRAERNGVELIWRVGTLPRNAGRPAAPAAPSRRRRRGQRRLAVR